MADNLSFSGSKTEDTELFIDRCKNLHISDPPTETNDKAILSTIIDSLQGDALTYFDTLPTHTRKDWSKLAAALKERFNKPGVRTYTDLGDVLASMGHLKQGDRKLAEYAREFEKATQHLSPQPHFQFMGAGRFVDSLSDEIAQKHLHLMMMKMSTLGKMCTVEEIVEAAVLWDNTTYAKECEKTMESAAESLNNVPKRTFRVNLNSGETVPE